MNSQIECSRPLKRKDIDVKTRSNILNRTRVEFGSYQRNKISLLKEDKFIPNTYRPISSVKNKVEGLTEIDNHVCFKPKKPNIETMLLWDTENRKTQIR